MDFKSYRKGQTKKEDREQAEQFIRSHEGLSEQALYDELFARIASAKQSGTFNPQALVAQAELLRPYLSPSQAERLNALLAAISSGESGGAK